MLTIPGLLPPKKQCLLSRQDLTGPGKDIATELKQVRAKEKSQLTLWDLARSPIYLVIAEKRRLIKPSKSTWSKRSKRMIRKQRSTLEPLEEEWLMAKVGMIQLLSKVIMEISTLIMKRKDLMLTSMTLPLWKKKLSELVASASINLSMK